MKPWPVFLLLLFVPPPPPQPSDIPPLVEALRNEPLVLEERLPMRMQYDSPGAQAVYPLASLGDPAVKPVAELLQSDSAIVRRNGALVLARIKGATADAAKREATAHADAPVRRLVAEGLTDKSNVDNVQALWSLLDDSDAKVRATAVMSLALREKDPVDLEKVLRTAGLNSYLRIKKLEAVVGDPDKSVRYGAAVALGTYRDESALPLLEVLLKDADPFVQSRAAEAMQRLGSRRSLYALINATRDADKYVVVAAATALGELRDPRATTTLLKLLKSNEPYIVRSAAGALGRIRDRRAVVPLIEALKSEEELTSSSVSWALGELGDLRAVEPVIEALRRDRDKTSDHVLALCKLGDDRGIRAIVAEIFSAQPAKSNTLAEALERGAPDAANPLLIRELAEHLIREPTHDHAYILRRTLARLVGEHPRWDPDDITAWWEQERTRGFYD